MRLKIMVQISKARVFCPVCNKFTNANISFTLEEAQYQCQTCHVHIIYSKVKGYQKIGRGYIEKGE